jgi:hypothetical protein
MTRHWIREKIRSLILPYNTKWYYPYRLPKNVIWAFRLLTSPLRVYPDFFIIGVGRGGTTSLEFYLTQHPNISRSSKKEIHYFDREFKRGDNWYKGHFITKFTKFYYNKIKKMPYLSCDATPTYIVHPDVIERIKKEFPNAKFLVTLRDPAKRAFSQYNRNIENHDENLSFLSALKNEKERAKRERAKYSENEFYNSRFWGVISYLENGHYSKLLKKWFSIFPKEQFHIVQTETFSKDPNLHINEIFKFLNLPECNSIDFTKQNTGIKKNMTNDEKEFLDKYFKKLNEELVELLGPNFKW